MTLLFSLLTATATPATPADWSPRTIELAGTLAGHEVTRTEVNGWIERRAGQLGGPSGGVRMEGRATARPSLAPSMDRAFEGERVDIGSTGGGIVQSGPLRAGITDDNAALGEFLEFLSTWGDKPGVAGKHVPMDVADQRFVRVADAAGQPVPGAHLVVEDTAGHVVWSGTTYGDGQAPFYAGLLELGGGDYRVTARSGRVQTSTLWNGKGDLALELDTPQAKPTVPLDVVFVIDTTGSMTDEIDQIKGTLLQVTERVRGLDTPVDLRYGAVLYRDLGDEYLTRHTPLTRDLEGFDRKLQGIRAAGGGDGPESFNQGLAVAVGEMAWRTDAAKMVFLVADAEPHMDYQGDTTYAATAQAAMDQGIRIHTVAASGLADFGSLVFRQTAQMTRGEFVFIEYGSTAASAADHGVTGPVQSNNLDAILTRQIEREIRGWGRLADTVASR